MDGVVTPPQVVSPPAIESTLNAIWEKLANQQKGAKMRACLFNLILVTKNTPRAAYIQGVAEKVIAKFPCRILFIRIQDGKAEEFQTAVAVIGVADHSSDVACDLIEFKVSEANTERITFSILPHLIPDLPVYVLWAEDPVKENPLSHQLEKFATRIIFDSESTDNLPLFAKSLLEHKKVDHCDIADLNWARTENWRNLLYSTFRSPQRLQELRRTKSIKIEYNALETTFFCHPLVQAIYVQGWLACQLDWQLQEFKRGKNTVFTYKASEGHVVTVELIPIIVQEAAPGAIINFILHTLGEENFRLVRSPENPQYVTTYLFSKDSCSIPTQSIFAKGGIGNTLVKEICRKGTQSHYLHLLEFLTKLESLWTT